MKVVKLEHMRATWLAAVSTALAVLLVQLTAGGNQQTPLFRSRTDLVPLYVTVTDASRRLVPGLTRDDFEIYDNDRPQDIALFQNDVQPITVVVMLDTSASMAPSIDLLRHAAEQFLLRLLPHDYGRVGAFNDKIQFSPEFTSDRDSLVRELKELDFGNPTRLYDAVAASLDVLRGAGERRVVLVFTDGDDTASSVGLGKVMDRARVEEVMVYAIGLESNYFNGARQVRSSPDRGLRKLAEETGGGYFELKRTYELSSTFTRVAQELHSQYVIGFAPAILDGKIHRLEVRVKQPDMTARARKSYLATADRPGSTES